MSVGNTGTQGNRKNNMPYQLAMLQLLEQISNNTLGSGVDHELITYNYLANKNGVGYSLGDFITRTQIIFVPTGAIISTTWFNQSTGLAIAAPPIADLDAVAPPTSIAVSNLPVVLGQALMANSLAVTIASDQSPLDVDLADTVRTPALTRVSAAGTVAAGARGVSVFNAGTANGTWLGAVIKPGEQLSYNAGAQGDTLGAFAYDGTGTELLISSIV